MILEIKPLSHYQNIVQVNEFLEKLEKVKGLSAGKHFMIRNNCVPNILGNNKDGLIIDFKLNDQFKKAGTVFGKITGVFSGSKNKFEIGTKEKSGTLKIELPEVKDLEKKSLKLKNETEFKENDDLQKKYQYELTQFFIKSKYWVSVVVSNKEIIIECYDNSEVGRLEKLFTEIEIAIISKNEGFIQISPPTLPLRETIQRIRRPQTINECIKVALWILKIQGIEPIRAQNISVSEKKQEFSTPFYFKNTLELITVKKILRAYDFSFAEEDKLGSEFAFRLEFKPLENPSSNTIDVTQASPVKLPKRKPGKVAKDLGFKSSGAINIAATEKTYLYTKGTLGGSERMSVGQKDTPHELRSTWCTELKEEMRKEGYLIEESPKRASYSFAFKTPKKTDDQVHPIVEETKIPAPVEVPTPMLSEEEVIAVILNKDFPKEEMIEKFIQMLPDKWKPTMETLRIMLTAQIVDEILKKGVILFRDSPGLELINLDKLGVEKEAVISKLLS